MPKAGGSDRSNNGDYGARSHNLHVQSCGSGMSVLALHRLTGPGLSWQRLAPYLPNIPLIAPDLLGFGRSPKSDVAYDLEAPAMP